MRNRPFTQLSEMRLRQDLMKDSKIKKLVDTGFEALWSTTKVMLWLIAACVVLILSIIVMGMLFDHIGLWALPVIVIVTAFFRNFLEIWGEV